MADSRPTKVNIGRGLRPLATIRRRRECTKCGERWTTFELTEGAWMGAPDLEKSLAAKQAQARRRGFVVPDHLAKEYFDLRENKHMGARGAAEAVGIIDRGGRVKDEYLPPPVEKPTKTKRKLEKKGKV